MPSTTLQKPKGEPHAGSAAEAQQWAGERVDEQLRRERAERERRAPEFLRAEREGPRNGRGYRTLHA